MDVDERLREIDEIIQAIITRASKNSNFLRELSESAGYKYRQWVFDNYVLQRLGDYGITKKEYEGLLIREEIAYRLHISNSEVDLGVCEHFEPRFQRNRRLLLEGSVKGLENACGFNENWWERGGEADVVSGICDPFDPDKCYLVREEKAYHDLQYKDWDPAKDIDIEDKDNPLI